VNLTSDDPLVKKAAAVNLLVESLMAVVSGVVFYQLVTGVNVMEKLAKKLDALRVKFFGPPPPGEEEIKRRASLLIIEATRITREAL
jgi:hypothetical protein